MTPESAPPAPPSSPPAPEPPTPVDSQAAFDAAFVWTLECALASGARRITWLDERFERWPLDQPVVLATLSTWLRLPQRRLVLVARHYDALPRRCPRFVAWRRDRTHAIDVWSPAAEVEAPLPTLAFDDAGHVLHVHSTQPWRGRAARDVAAARRWAEECDTLLQRCDAAFPAYPLGL